MIVWNYFNKWVKKDLDEMQLDLVFISFSFYLVKITISKMMLNYILYILKFKKIYIL